MVLEVLALWGALPPTPPGIYRIGAGGIPAVMMGRPHVGGAPDAAALLKCSGLPCLPCPS